MSYTYDGLNRLNRTTYAETTNAGVANFDVVRTYYRNHWPSTVSTVNKSGGTESLRTYTYTPNGRLQSDQLDVDGLQLTVGYSYDDLDYLTQQTARRYPGSYTGKADTHLNDVLTANAFGWTSSLKVDGTKPLLSQVLYHPNGVVKQADFGNGQIMTNTLNSRRWLLRSTVSNGAVKPMDYEYAYQKNGNVSGITDHLDGSANRAFTYDQADRLQTASGKWGTSRAFSYDATGNLITMDIGDGTYRRNLAYTYTGPRLNSVTGATDGSRTFAYDDYGNVTDDSLNSYAYDDAGQLRNLGGRFTKSYAYDGNGLRIKQVSAAGTEYLLYNQSGQPLMIVKSRTADPVTVYHYLGRQQVAVDQRTWVYPEK